MKEQVIEILNEHYGRLDIIDFEIEYQGALLTHVVLTKDEEIQFGQVNLFIINHQRFFLMKKLQNSCTNLL